MESAMTEPLTLRNVSGPLSKLLENLSGTDGSQWATALERFLILGTQESTLARRPRPWQTVMLGAFNNGAEYIHELTNERLSMNEKAREMLDSLSCENVEKEVTLVRMSVGDLALPDGVNYEQIFERAQALGLSACSQEVGPALRLQFRGQPRGEKLLIATQPFTDTSVSARLFELECEKGVRWLRGVGGGKGGMWGKGALFVFTDPTQ